MNGLLKFFETKISPPLLKIGENRYIMAIKDGMIVTVPFTIIGSIFMILAQFPMDAYQKIIAPYKEAISTPVNVTFGMIGIIALFGITYYLSKIYKLDGIRNVVMAFTSFLLVQTELLKNGSYQINWDNFGTKGLFTAIVVAVVVVEISRFCDRYKLTIKMPASVPEAISRSFSILIPLLFSLTLFWILSILFKVDINAILNMLFSPLVFSLGTLPGIFIFFLVRSLLWCIGIHGGAVLAVADPIFLAMLGKNVDAYANGQTPPYITAAGFETFVFIGGGGATLMLVVFMMMSKNKGLRTLGRLSFPSGLFEINEPVVFGAPIVLNPVLMIPYILSNMTLVVLTYTLMYFDLIGRPVVMVPWTMPPILMQYLASGGDWRCAVYGAAALVITGLIYYPFFKLFEKQREEEETLERDASFTETASS